MTKKSLSNPRVYMTAAKYLPGSVAGALEYQSAIIGKQFPNQPIDAFPRRVTTFSVFVGTSVGEDVFGRSVRIEPGVHFGEYPAQERHATRRFVILQFGVALPGLSVVCKPDDPSVLYCLNIFRGELIDLFHSSSEQQEHVYKHSISDSGLWRLLDGFDKTAKLTIGKRKSSNTLPLGLDTAAVKDHGDAISSEIWPKQSFQHLEFPVYRARPITVQGPLSFESDEVRLLKALNSASGDDGAQIRCNSRILFERFQINRDSICRAVFYPSVCELLDRRTPKIGEGELQGGARGKFVDGHLLPKNLDAVRKELHSSEMEIGGPPVQVCGRASQAKSILTLQAT